MDANGNGNGSGTAVRSGDAVFAFGDDLIIRTWNEATARLTGIPAEEAVGLPCWLVLGASGPRGEMLCHAGCANARIAREGWPVEPQTMDVPGVTGEKQRVRTSTVRIDHAGERLYLHVLQPAAVGEEEPEPEPEPDPGAERAPELTARQRQILELAAHGRGARSIAAELRLAESTVRNHIRGILLAFGAHSQLEAVAKARRCGVLRHV
jgi:DNA-binding CsgD family transcriptional regulator